ncbi:fungal specific transcription factor domain-containing protein [Fusarium austroafricanum]|uniref:Fungal specific transcription factor domain-containing protein n=1 Tax=Fusarium austroafricanum TaxID=2364996 RepID=A0A8H4NZ64_9HYPO|nr:fungal specific transcription factor domain-containing protein [Fusarium austroafricanum]
MGVECLYVPRRPSSRQPQSLVILERLRHLEGVISRMQQHLDPALVESLTSTESTPGSLKADSTTQSDSTQSIDEIAELDTELGKLAMDDGRSIYIIGNSWASLDDEVQDLKSMLQSQTDEPEAWFSDVVPDIYPNTDASILGFGSTCQSLSQMHPPAEKIPVYWKLFKENCDILIKVLHIPTIEPLILQSHPFTRRPKGLEALMISVYFTVVVSLSPEECLQLLGDNKVTLLRMYKSATEQALSQAGLLETDELITLQAFAIFLTGLRVHNSVRVMSTLTALLVRLAQNAGIHRDGTHFKLSPFEVEMRRRLWWSICVLDSRASEDTGYDATIPLGSVDTQLPRNVNDSDLFPTMLELPKSRVGLTEMTFSVVRFESTKVFQQLQQMSAGSTGKPSAQTLKNKTEMISNIQHRIHELYLKHLDLSNPFAWYAYTICTIVFTKMRLVTYHPYLRKGMSVDIPADAKDSLFAESTLVIESWLALNEERSTRRWKWLCETYYQCGRQGVECGRWSSASRI